MRSAKRILTASVVVATSVATFAAGVSMVQAATLTAGQFAAGVRASTKNPKGLVDDVLANYAASILSTTSLYQTGQESGKNYPRAGEIGVCLSARNPGQCINCCKDQGTAGNSCATFCQALIPPSPSTP